MYFDYSATTPVNPMVLDSFQKACLTYVGNPNSIHRLGMEANHMIERATEQIATQLNIKPTEIIYTSGSSESNNLALKGIAFQYQNRGKHIISGPLEHSSISETLTYLKKQGFIIDIVRLDEQGQIDREHLKSLLTDSTILVTISSVDSELGILQPIQEIGVIVKQYPKCFFHVDMTQSMGKVNIPLDLIDLASFSAHKFYGLKGIGCLIKKEKIELEPLIHGGKSTTIYRSGTPPLPLIVSLAKALRIAFSDLEEHEQVVTGFCKEIIANLNPNIAVNHVSSAIPHILNISILSIKPETFLRALEEKNIYISTKSACSKNYTLSQSVLTLTNDTKKALSSVRISISHLTTKQEVEALIESCNECFLKLRRLEP